MLTGVAGPAQPVDRAARMRAMLAPTSAGMGDVKAAEQDAVGADPSLRAEMYPATVAREGFDQQMSRRNAQLRMFDAEIRNLDADLAARPPVSQWASAGTGAAPSRTDDERIVRRNQFMAQRANLLANNERAVPVNVGLPRQAVEPQGFIGSAVGAFSGGMQDVGDIPTTLSLVTGPANIENVNRFVTNLQMGRNRPQSQGSAVFGQAASTGAGEMFRQMYRQPGMMLQGAVDQSAQSLGGQAASIGAAGLAAIGGSPATGLAVIGAGSAAAELNGELAGALQEIGGVYNLGDAGAILRALNDPKTGPAIRQRVLTKAGTIGLVDALTAKASNMIPGGSTLKRQIGSAAAKMGTEMLGGGGGEALGSVASGQDINSGAVLAEMIGEVGPGAAQIAALSLGRPTRAPAPTREDAQKIVDDLIAQTKASEEAARRGGRPDPSAPFQVEIDAQASMDAYNARRAGQATPPAPVGGTDAADPSGAVTPGNTGERAGVEFSDSDLDSFYAGQRRKQNERETAEDTSLRSMGLDPARMRQQLYTQRMRERFAIDRELNIPPKRAPQPNADEVTDSERMREIANVLAGLDPNERAVVVQMIRQGYEPQQGVPNANVANPAGGQQVLGAGQGLPNRGQAGAGMPAGPLGDRRTGMGEAGGNAPAPANQGGPVAPLGTPPVSVATPKVDAGVGGVVGTQGAPAGTQPGDVDRGVKGKEPWRGTLYHGSRNASITRLEPQSAPQWGKAIYFSDDAKAPTEEYGTGGRVYEATLKDDANVLDARKGIPSAVKRQMENTTAFKQAAAKRSEQMGGPVTYDDLAEDGAWSGAALKEIGYDAVVGRMSEGTGNEIAVFNPDAIVMRSTPNSSATLTSSSGQAPLDNSPRARVSTEMSAAFGPEQAANMLPVIDAYARSWAKGTGRKAEEFFAGLSVKQGGTPGEGAMFQSDNAPVWFSKLSQVVGEKMGGAMDAAQLTAMLQNNGVKPEEMEWAKIGELKGKVTKQQVMDHLAENAVQVTETTLGPSAPHKFGTPQEQAAATERLNTAERALATPGLYEDNPEAKARLAAVQREFREAQAAMRTIVPGWGIAAGSSDGGTKFQQYVLPGGTEYRELLLTLPVKPARGWQDHRDAIIKALENQTAYKGNVAVGADEVRRYLLGKTDVDMNAVEAARKAVGQKGFDAYQAALTDPSNKRVVSESFKSGHFDQPNILAHVRFNTRTDADGKKVLFLEEIQSDWHQKGREKGYATDSRKAAKAEDKGGYFEVTDSDGNFITNVYGTSASTPEQAVAEANRRLVENPRSTSLADSVPNAPFKKSWHELAMKRMIRYAAENGYDRVAWTTGEQQNRRYDLSQQVRSIEWTHGTASDDAPRSVLINLLGEKRPLRFDVRDGMVFNPNSYATDAGLGGKPLEDVVGKDIAKQILEKERGELSGDGLAVGGEGMRGFYDKILPESTNKLIKRHGARVGMVKVPAQDTGERLSVVGNDVEGAESNRYYIKDATDGKYISEGPWKSRAEAEARLREILSDPYFAGKSARYEGPANTDRLDRMVRDREENAEVLSQARRVLQATRGEEEMPFAEAMSRYGSDYLAALVGGRWLTTSSVKTAPAHGFDITPSMKQEAMSKGMPLFQDGRGSYEILASGERIIRALTNPNASTLPHEVAHDFLANLPAVDPKLAEQAAKALGVEKHADIGMDQQETFARGFEAYLRDGEAPSAELKTVFARFRTWLLDIYKSIVGTPLENKMSPALKAVFDRMLTAGDLAAMKLPELKAEAARRGLDTSGSRKDLLERLEKPAEAKPKAPEKPKTPSQGDQIGTNADGNPLYQDARGVRSYVIRGIRITEAVRMGPRGEFNGVGTRGDDFLTAEERGETVEETTPEETPTKQAYTNIDRDWIGRDLFAFNSIMVPKLRKGEKGKGGGATGNRATNQMPLRFTQQLAAIPTDAKSVVAWIQARTDEVWKLSGTVGRGFTLVPRSIVDEAKAANPGWEKEVADAKERRDAKRAELMKKRAEKPVDPSKIKPVRQWHQEIPTADIPDLAKNDPQAAMEAMTAIEREGATDGTPVPEFDADVADDAADAILADFDAFLAGEAAEGDSATGGPAPQSGLEQAGGDQGGGGNVDGPTGETRKDEKGVFGQFTEPLTGSPLGLFTGKTDRPEPKPAAEPEPERPGIRAGESVADYEKRMGLTDTPVMFTPPAAAAPEPAAKRPSVLSVLSAEDQAEVAKIRAQIRGMIDGSRPTSGVDPAIGFLAARLGSFYLKAGIKRFAIFAQEMIRDGGTALRPYLKAAYVGARQMPGVDRTGTDSGDYIDSLSEADIDQIVAGVEEAPAAEPQATPEPTPEPAADEDANDADAILGRIKAALERGSGRQSADMIRSFQELGTALQPGVRLQDAEELGRMYHMLDKGDVTLAEYTNYVADLRATGKIRSNAAPAPTPPAPPVDDTPTEDAAPEQDLGQEDVKAVVRAVADYFAEGKGFKTIVEARRFIGQITGDTAKGGTTKAKQVDEIIEQGVVLAARKIVAAPGTTAQKYRALVDLYGRQPRLGTRTGTSMLLQAYSTPVPLAYVASRLAGVNPKAAVYEPAAGTGMLLIEARGSNTIANEFDPARVETLRPYGFTVTEGDGATTAPPDQSIDAVIANPPFGRLVDQNGREQRWAMGAGKTRELDQAMVARSLQSMKDDGRAVFIVGGIMDRNDGADRASGYAGKSKAPFYLWLYSNYNVVDHFTVSGDLYDKQGAGFPVDVIVIDGKGKSALQLPAAQAPRMYESWDAIEEVLNNEVAVPRSQESPSSARKPASGVGAGAKPAEGSQPRPVPNAPGRADSGNDGRSGEQAGRPANPAPRPMAGDARRGTESGVAGVGDSERDRQPAGGPERDSGVPGQDVLDQPATDPADGGTVAGGMAAVPPGQVAPSIETTETTFQVTYKPVSEGNNMGTLLPRAHAEPARSALETIQSEVGDLSTFVAKELGWTKAQLQERLGAEQIDAVVSAIYQAKKGSGFVLGDQTGIGKGRVVATMLTWAARNKKIPVFVTERPTLYADILRDFVDIGAQSPMILPTNNNLTGKNVITTPDGLTVRSVSDVLSVINRVASEFKRSGKLTDGKRSFTAIATAYTQLAGPDSIERRRMFSAIAPDSFFVFDESHNAGGQPPSGWDAGGVKTIEEMNRSEFIRALIDQSGGVMYSSATWAKRPDVMDLYRRTDMRLAVDRIEDLGAAIKRGGVAMQQVVSASLVRLGQYLRRERSYAGVEMNATSVEAPRESVEAATSVFSNVAQFDRLKKDDVEKIKTQLSGQAVMRPDGSTGQRGVESTNFTSQLHNAVSQMNLASKVDKAADAIIASARSGEKVVVVLENTMESIVSSQREDDGAAFGAEAKVSFKSRLRTHLRRSRELLLERYAPDGSRSPETYYMTDADLSPAALAAYRQAEASIELIDDTTLPVSPIDWLLFRLQAAGLRTGEITGRKERLEYAGAGKAIYSQRSDAERSESAKINTISGFQNGTIDVVIINTAGATGISLHADKKRAKDQRRRHMFILQAIRNIDVFMQALGRVHRTGQVVPPRYTLLSANIPSEKRPAAVLSKKMASLNANVSSERSGAVGFDAPDLLNQVGDDVIFEWLAGEREVFDLLFPEGRSPEIDENEPGSYANKVTGRLALLPLADQERTWDSLATLYRQRIKMLDAVGENPLEAKLRDIKAKTTDVREWLGARPGPKSWFTSPAVIETVRMRAEVPPLDEAKVLEVMATMAGVEASSNRAETIQRSIQALAAKSEERRKVASEYEKAGRDKLKTSDAKQRHRDNFQSQYSTLRELMNFATPGNVVDLPMIGPAIVMGVEERDVTKNPLALSRFELVVALPDERNRAEIAFTQLSKWINPANPTEILARGGAEPSTLTGEKAVEAWQQQADAAANPTSTRFIVTGNILAAMPEITKKTSNAYTIMFTRDDGRSDVGVILPRQWTNDMVNSLVGDRPRSFTSSKNAARFITTANASLLFSPGADLRIDRDGSSGIKVRIDGKRQTAARFLAMKGVTRAAGTDWVRNNNGHLVLTVASDRAAATIEALTAADVSLRVGRNFDLVRLPDVPLTPEEQAKESAYQADLARYDAIEGTPPTTPPGSPDAPGRTSSRLGSMLDRFGEALSRVERNAQARLDAFNRQGPRLYSNAFADPEVLRFVADMSVVAIAKAVRGTGGVIIKGGRALSAIVNEVAARNNATPEQAKAVRRIALKALKAGVTKENFETIAADMLTPLRTKAQAKRDKKAAGQARAAAVAGITNPADTSGTVSGKDALKARLRGEEKVGEKVAKQAVREIKKTMGAVFNRARTRYYREGVTFVRDAINKRRRNREAINEIERRTLIGYAKSLPPEVSGKIVASIAEASSPGQYMRAMRMLEREAVRHQARQDLRWIKKNTSPKKIDKAKGMTDALRKQIRQARAKTIVLSSQIRAKGADIFAMQRAGAEISRIRDRIAIAIKTARSEYRVMQHAKRMSAVQAGMEIASNVRASSPDLTKPEDMRDVEVGAIRRLFRGAKDIRNLAQRIEGKIGGMLEKVLWERFEDAEDAMFARSRDTRAALETAFKRAGFDSLADAQRITSGRGGEGTTRKITVTLAGEQKTISLGDMIDLLGHSSDPMTAQLIASDKGQGFQSGLGRFRRSIEITPAEIDAIRAQHDPDGKYARLVEDIKAVFETLKPDAFAVHMRMKGFEPEGIEGRWPRARNVDAVAETAKLPETAGDMVHRFLENDGMFETRKQTTGVPIVLQDPVSMALDQIDRSVRTIYLAEPTRDAANVLFRPEVREAVASRFGPATYTMLKRHVMMMSRADRVLGTGGARVVSVLNSAAAVSNLGLNPGTWAVTLTSAIRLLPIMGPKAFLAGIAGAKNVSMQEILSKSGYAYDRYEGHHAADRFSAVVSGGPAVVSDNRVMAEMGAAGSNLMALDFSAAGQNFRNVAQTTMGVLNWFDSLIMRVAWAGYQAEARAEHPNWERSQRDAWVAKQARRVMRETQNGSSPVDMALGPASVRDSGAAAFTLFSSDIFKTRNRLERAWRKGLGSFTAAAAAELTSIAIGLAFRKSIWLAVSGAFALAFGMDDEDEERLVEKFTDPKVFATDFMREVSGIVVPIIGTNVFDAFSTPVFRDNRVLEAPALGMLDETLAATIKAYEAVQKYLEDEASEERVVIEVGRALNQAAGLGGVNPFTPILRRFLTEWSEAEKQAN